MTRSLLGIAVAGLLASLLATSPSRLFGQSTNPPAAETKAAAKAAPPKKPAAGPFHGKLAAIDPAAKTITVGKRTFQITSETKLQKAGKPALLSDGVVGESASGYVKPTEAGGWLATTVNFGPKPPAKGTDKTAKAVAPKKEGK